MGLEDYDTRGFVGTIRSCDRADELPHISPGMHVAMYPPVGVFVVVQLCCQNLSRNALQCSQDATKMLRVRCFQDSCPLRQFELICETTVFHLTMLSSMCQPGHFGLEGMFKCCAHYRNSCCFCSHEMDLRGVEESHTANDAQTEIPVFILTLSTYQPGIPSYFQSRRSFPTVARVRKGLRKASCGDLGGSFSHFSLESRFHKAPKISVTRSFGKTLTL